MNKDKIIEFLRYMITKPYGYQLSRKDMGGSDRWSASVMGSGMSFVWFLGSFAIIEIEFKIKLFYGLLLPISILFWLSFFIVNFTIILKLEIAENQLYHDLFWIIYLSPAIIAMSKAIYGWTKSIWAMMMI